MDTEGIEQLAGRRLERNVRTCLKHGVEGDSYHECCHDAVDPGLSMDDDRRTWPHEKGRRLKSLPTKCDRCNRSLAFNDWDFGKCDRCYGEGASGDEDEEYEEDLDD